MLSIDQYWPSERPNARSVGAGSLIWKKTSDNAGTFQYSDGDDWFDLATSADLTGVVRETGVQTVDAKTLTSTTMIQGTLTSAVALPAATLQSTFSGVVSVQVLNGGSGYTSVPAVSFTPTNGGSGAAATATVDAGQIGSVTVTAPGAGYASSFAVTFTGGGGSGATATATAVGGQVQSVTMTAYGSGYTSAPTPVFTAGGGAGAAGTAIRGRVTGITVTSTGSGYLSWPTVGIGGAVGVQATAQAVLSYTALQSTMPDGSGFYYSRSTSGIPQLYVNQGNLIVNHTSLQNLSEVMVNFDFTSRAANADAGTLTVFCGEGKINGRSDASFTPSGAAGALRGIEVRGVWGTWAGLIAAGAGGNRHGIGIGIETNLARADNGTGAYAGEVMGLFIQHTNNTGQFLDPGNSDSANCAINIGGAQNATTTQCAFEWPIYVTGLNQTPAIWSVYRDGRTGLAKSANPSHGGMLQINQVAGDATGSGIRLFPNGGTASYGEAWIDGNKVLNLQAVSSGVGGTILQLGPNPAGTGLLLSAAAAAGPTRSGPLLDLSIGGIGQRFKIDTSGYGYVQGTKIFGAQGAAVADVASANATDLPTAITLVNEIKAQVNTAFARLRAATGHGLWA